MTKIILWQMLLGSIGFLVELALVVAGQEPSLLIVSASIALLGGGTIQQIGKGGGNGK